MTVMRYLFGLSVSPRISTKPFIFVLISVLFLTFIQHTTLDSWHTTWIESMQWTASNKTSLTLKDLRIVEKPKPNISKTKDRNTVYVTDQFFCFSSSTSITIGQRNQIESSWTIWRWSGRWPIYRLGEPCFRKDRKSRTIPHCWPILFLKIILFFQICHRPLVSLEGFSRLLAVVGLPHHKLS